jgi:hypothetical protein
MKVRNGFVSNSSSSSFLVAFPRKPKNVNEVKEILFSPGQNDYPNPFVYGMDDKDTFWPVDQVAKIVWNDIKKPATNEEMIECRDGGWFDTYEGLPGHVDVYRNARRDEKFRQMQEECRGLDWSTDEGRIKHQAVWSAINKENVKRAKAILKRFKEKNPDAVFYTFEYSDNDGSLFSAMEHGTLFRRVFHIKTSRH